MMPTEIATTAANAITRPVPATLRQSAALLIARSAPGRISLAIPHEPNAASSPSTPTASATTVVLASSADVRLGTARNVVLIVLKRYSVVIVNAASTRTTASANWKPNCELGTLTDSM